MAGIGGGKGRGRLREFWVTKQCVVSFFVQFGSSTFTINRYCLC